MLATDREGNPTEAFTPDFYLPASALVMEIPPLNQKLVRGQTRTARKLQERHPEVKIKIFYQRDYLRLLVRYGLEPPSQHVTAEDAAGELPPLRFGDDLTDPALRDADTPRTCTG